MVADRREHLHFSAGNEVMSRRGKMGRRCIDEREMFELSALSLQFHIFPGLMCPDSGLIFTCLGKDFNCLWFGEIRDSVILGVPGNICVTLME